MAPVLIGALLGFVLGAIFGVSLACRFLEWAQRQPASAFDVDELIERKRREWPRE